MPLRNLFRQRITITAKATAPNKNGIYLPSSTVTYSYGRFEEKKQWLLQGDETKLVNLITCYLPISSDVNVGDYITIPNGDIRPIKDITYKINGVGNQSYLEVDL